MLVLTIKVNNKSGLSLERDRRLKASEAVHFESEKREEVLRLGERCVGEQNRDELGRMARNWCGGNGKNDGAEPRADHASDHPLRGGWRGAG